MQLHRSRSKSSKESSKESLYSIRFQSSDFDLESCFILEVLQSVPMAIICFQFLPFAPLFEPFLGLCVVRLQEESIVDTVESWKLYSETCPS
jgi:hypothetical protein